MTAPELTAWRNRMGLNQTRAALALGISRNALIAYESGKQPVPLYIELAGKWLELAPQLTELREALEMLKGAV
jgi:DNA-binding XRE family transcriptional regulator